MAHAQYEELHYFWKWVIVGFETKGVICVVHRGNPRTKCKDLYAQANNIYDYFIGAQLQIRFKRTNS
jgi:hypothetical protein